MSSWPLGGMVGAVLRGGSGSRVGQVWLDRGSLSSEPDVFLVTATSELGGHFFHRLVRLTDLWEHEWIESYAGELEAEPTPLTTRLL